MRKILYSVAMSLDGYIARADGGYDWIPDEPGIDWEAFLGRFDTVLMGRRTYEVVAAGGGDGPTASMDSYVFSSTLDPAEHDAVRIVSGDPGGLVEELRSRPGRDIWLMGGGALFRSFLDRELVDGVEAAVIPVLLGDGIPFLARREGEAPLALVESHTYGSGIVTLAYDVETAASGAESRPVTT